MIFLIFCITKNKNYNHISGKQIDLNQYLQNYFMCECKCEKDPYDDKICGKKEEEKN